MRKIGRATITSLVALVVVSACLAGGTDEASAECRTVSTGGTNTETTVSNGFGGKRVRVSAKKTMKTICDDSDARRGGYRNPVLTPRQKAEAAARKYAAKLRVFDREVDAYLKCVESVSARGVTCARPKPPAQPRGSAVGEVIPGVTVTPQQAAYMALADLTLTAPMPNIGPPPSINPWKMAAVGYPLWLSADGNLDPAPVSDSVGGLSVALDARVDHVVFRMGDGRSVTCQGTGTKWSRSVTPGTPSPSCGYRYEKPSLPKGKYTVTVETHWAVDWRVNGATGTIPLVQQASTQLPVGELQVLVR